MVEEEEKEEVVSGDARTTISKITGVTKSGAVHKHCLLGNCGGKRINGGAWATHVKDIHSSMDGKKEGEAFNRCSGDGCTHCTKGK